MDVLRLAGRSGIARFEIAQSIVAATPDDTRDARTTALTKIADVRQRLETSMVVINAIDERLILRPAPPPPVTLQDLVRSGRRRLAEERQRGARGWLEVRTTTVERLRDVLER
jgi:hypothetical protein